MIMILNNMYITNDNGYHYRCQWVAPFLLIQATKHWRASGSSFSNEDITLMAQTVYREARGEPYTGQVAVAAF